MASRLVSLVRNNESDDDRRARLGRQMMMRQQALRSECFKWQGLNSKDMNVALLNWRAIIVATAICFGVGCVIGFAWGVMAFAIVATASPSVENPVDHPAWPVAGFIVGLMPSIVGAAYLGRQLKSKWWMHGIAYAILNFLISVTFMLIPFEEGTSLAEIGYSLLLIPISVATVFYAARSN